MKKTKTALEQHLHQFLGELADAEVLDAPHFNLQFRNDQRADFLLNSRNVILEIKSLESDPQYKVDERLKQLQSRPDYPVFYWDAELKEILSHLPDGKEIHLEIAHAVTRSVEKALKSADDQIESTRRILNLPDAGGVVILLNQDIGILSPDVVAARISHTLLKRHEGQIRYKNIAYVLLICESHKLTLGRVQEGLPLILVEGPSAVDHVETESYLEVLQIEWAKFRGIPLFSVGEREDFKGLNFARRTQSSPKAKDNPMARHEQWRASYRRNPYFRSLSEPQFVKVAIDVITALAPHFIKGKRTLEPSVLAALSARWTCVLEEAEYRRLDMSKIQCRLPDLRSL